MSEVSRGVPQLHVTLPRARREEIGLGTGYPSPHRTSQFGKGQG